MGIVAQHGHRDTWRQRKAFSKESAYGFARSAPITVFGPGQSFQEEDAKYHLANFERLRICSIL